MGYDDLRRDDLATALDARVDDTAEGASAVLGATFAEASYPTTPGSVFALHPVDLDGDESEGAGYSAVVDPSRTLHALNLGTGLPTAGTLVVCHAVGGRWVFRHDG